MLGEREVAIAFHVLLITFMLWHLSSVVNWSVVLSRWYYVLPLLIIPFIRNKKLKLIYSAFLIYAVFSTITHLNSWMLASARYFGTDAPTTLAWLSLLASALYTIVTRSARGLMAFLCCLSGIALRSEFTLLNLALHISLVTSFLIVLLWDLHAFVWPVNYILALHRRRNRVV
ncbi:hypothetical protein IPA_03325 [Ignicoccus pacificus DSM 13166]|uniref:Uncharacterized protein n=1 Tax=Ignicoccus pacificus DSM 13166 TaxID=940294 RepID=A0A977KAY5_9CREN|nr:hypothetical protein IPA_03325 [Ignicoccus pacificus DSM 13166]